MSAVEVRDLFRVYSTPEGDAAALQGLTLDVEKREVVVVLGPSGSGKTTLLRILAGLERPSAGVVRVFGTNVAILSALARGAYRTRMLGYVEQHYERVLVPELSVRELVALPLELRGVSRRRAAARADALLERVGLAAKRDARPGELSGGEQQRIAVCAGLAHEPKLLLADEPTGELDPVSAARIYRLIGDLAREEGCTAIIVSHDSASTAIADRVVNIRDGRLAAELDSEDGTAAIVVGRGGWIHLPQEYLLRAGIGSHATASVEDGKIVVEATAGSHAERPVERPRLPRIEAAPATANGTVAELLSISKRYGDGPRATTVFAGLVARFAAGTLAAITGPSGSGKTTLLHLIAGLEPPSGGQVRILGRPTTGLGRASRARLRASSVALVGQQSGLIPFLSAEETVELGLALRGLGPDEAKERALDALSAVGLGPRSGQRISRLSSGEQARVAIARALAIRPAVLLADEPTSRLDQANGLAITALFRQLVSEHGLLIICATHDPVVIEQSDDELELVPIHANAASWGRAALSRP